MQLPSPYNENNELNVVIETPKGSSFKSSYDEKRELFCLGKTLPLGMHFPYDFGFIPGTLGEDGAPLDVLVLSPYPLFIGCLVTIKLIGVLEAEQTEKESKNTIRNDRLMGCLDMGSGDINTVSNAKDLPQQFLKEIEAFFIQYNRLEGKQFRSLGWFGPKRARELLEKGIKAA